MISSFKLPFNFDTEALRSDLARIAPDEWVAHFNQDYFEGEWSGVSLRSSSGDSRQLNSRTAPEISFTDTPTLQRCQYVREILATFQCTLQAVRFLKLAAGSRIREHRDSDLGFEDGQMRFHIPVTTNPDLQFFLDAHRVELQPGECWYLNLSLPHWVENRGTTDRVHLVIDCQLNEWIRGFLPPDESIESESNESDDGSSSPEELQRFRQTVLNDLNLQQRLCQTDDRESFIRLLVALGRQLGYRFTPVDVDNAMRAEQRAWIERWID
jgi:mannose-6-phosphate isomerase-like protein (cupin superfamily)